MQRSADEPVCMRYTSHMACRLYFVAQRTMLHYGGTAYYTYVHFAAWAPMAGSNSHRLQFGHFMQITWASLAVKEYLHALHASPVWQSESVMLVRGQMFQAANGSFVQRMSAVFPKFEYFCASCGLSCRTLQH